jgi:hypothetical protein
MKKILFFIAFVAIFSACNSYGDKYLVNSKSEVYYKDGMTAGDAKLLGDFLLKNGYFDSTNERSVQLAREKDTINVKFVVDKEKMSSDIQNADALFMIMGTALSAEVFGAKPLKIILADQYMKGFRNVIVPGTVIEEPKK